MKAQIVITLVGAAAAPFVLESTVGVIDPAISADSDLMARAEEIARREFSANATIEVDRVWVEATRIGTFGEKIRPDHGYSFHYAQVSIQNTGKLDFAVSTWHFSGIDEIGSDRGVELGNAHEDFDASRLSRGQTRTGVVIFELPKGSYLTGIHWQGELAETNATAPPYTYP